MADTDKATTPAVLSDAPTVAPVPEAPADPTPALKAPKCPVCKGPLDPYTGANPLKFGTGWCDKDGRQPLKG